MGCLPAGQHARDSSIQVGQAARVSELNQAWGMPMCCVAVVDCNGCLLWLFIILLEHN